MSETDETTVSEPQTIAAETMVAALMSITLDELKNAQDAWQKLGDKEQDETIERVEKRAKDAVLQCVRMIATQSFTRLPASLDSVTVKDVIKAQLSISKSDPSRHDLFDSTGKLVTVVLADVAQFLDAPHGHKAESNQLGLALGKIADSDQAQPSNDGAPGAEAA